jgi:hypothetical protein
MGDPSGSIIQQAIGMLSPIGRQQGLIPLELAVPGWNRRFFEAGTADQRLFPIKLNAAPIKSGFDRL